MHDLFFGSDYTKYAASKGNNNDNDMDLDLYVTNDKGLKFLFINDGAGNFSRNNDEIITANFGNSMGNYFFDVQ